MVHNTDSICVRCIIYGKVQGVFFRASTRDQAQKLGVLGYAKNLPNGNVEVVACGTKYAIDELCTWLHQGPIQADVSKVECESIERHTYIDFQTF